MNHMRDSFKFLLMAFVVLGFVLTATVILWDRVTPTAAHSVGTGETVTMSDCEFTGRTGQDGYMLVNTSCGNFDGGNPVSGVHKEFIKGETYSITVKNVWYRTHHKVIEFSPSSPE